MPVGYDEVRPSYKRSGDVNGNVGLVVRSLWSVDSRRHRREGNERYPQEDNHPAQILYGETPS
jgi:hypothetical protein